MRGVVTLALALSLPEDFQGRDFILITAFAVILGTVLIQGTTLEWIIAWAGLGNIEPERAPMTMSEAKPPWRRSSSILSRHSLMMNTEN